MKKIITFFCLQFFLFAQAQEYSSSNIHSHNDYAGKLPFYEAYSNETGVIEADVFIVNNELFVAHTSKEINAQNTLKSQYLDPLSNKLKSFLDSFSKGELDVDTIASLGEEKDVNKKKIVKEDIDKDLDINDLDTMDVNFDDLISEEDVHESEE